MEEVISVIITAAQVVGAVGVILGVVFAVYKWVLRQNKQDADIKQLQEKQERDNKKLNEENTLICYALSACLDGLEQLGANHTVPKAKEKLEKYLNLQAHK